MNADANVEESLPSRFLVGIDLGTTNCAVSFIDSEQEHWQVETFSIPQVIAASQVESRETLPSFHYQATRDEFPAGALIAPWESNDSLHVVGNFAREQGKLVPGRVIESAKSWLCHPGCGPLRLPYSPGMVQLMWRCSRLWK